MRMAIKQVAEHLSMRTSACLSFSVASAFASVRVFISVFLKMEVP